jgi:hypothetical protein
LARPGRGAGAWPPAAIFRGDHPIPAALVIDVPVAALPVLAHDVKPSGFLQIAWLMTQELAR